MAFTLEYHHAEDRMTVHFALPSGEARTCWVTRRQWLFLILLLSSPADLPTQIDRPTKEKSAGGGSTQSFEPDQFEQASRDTRVAVKRDDVAPRLQAEADQQMIVKRIGVVKTQNGLRISFRALEHKDDQSDIEKSEKINLNISSGEREILLTALNTKARQAGWDPGAGLKRLRENQRAQKAKAKPMMH